MTTSGLWVKDDGYREGGCRPADGLDLRPSMLEENISHLDDHMKEEFSEKTECLENNA